MNFKLILITIYAIHWQRCEAWHQIDKELQNDGQSEPPIEATFRGTEYLNYDLRSGEPILSSSDEISLFFKTRQTNGLLFYSGDGQADFLSLALRDGGIVLTVKLGSATLEKVVKPTKVRFDDNQWHKVLVHRKVSEITRATSFCHFSITIDGVYTERGSTAGAFSLLTTNVIYVGGSDHTDRLTTAKVQPNFVGCLTKVEFTADTSKLDLMEMGRSETIKVTGNMPFQCQEVEAADPITFTTRDSFLELPRWESARGGSISLKIRTNEPHGVLVYNSGAENGIGQSSDFFAFELLDGHIYLLLNLGSGTVKVKATQRRVDDGHWHSVSLSRTGRTGRVAVDESTVDFISPGSSNQLDLEGPLFIGSVGTQPPDSLQTGQTLPPELWSGSLRYGFVGCLRDLVINGDAVDVAAFARKQDSGSIRPACHTSGPQCESQPCMNGGSCLEGWNRFTCDCSHTSFTGPVCAKDATTLSFDGHQFMSVVLPEESHTQAELIQMRFRTTRPNGLLMNTASNDKSFTHFTLLLESGRAKVSINFGEGVRVVHIGQSLNDDLWHWIRIERRGPSIEVRLDKETQVVELTGQLIALHISSIHIGAHHSHHTSGHYPTKDVPNFVGSIQNFVLNGNHYFEMARDGQISNLNLTARLGKKERMVHHPVTFKSKYTFIGLPQLKAYSTINLYLQFKTLESDGLLLFNAGKNQDFIALELVSGHLNYIFNLGDGARKVRSNTRTTLNDNRWHAITIGRPSLRQHTLMVDDMLATVASTGSNVHLDLEGLLYLGGVRTDMFDALPKLVQSRHGFEGCIASLDLNGETLDPSGSDALIPSTLVATGCSGPVTKCSSNACANRGICVQMWNSYTCDCDMTSYSGPTCADGNESTAYQFGSNNGLITFNFPTDKRPDTKNDLLALGFLTSDENAVLVRIESGTSNDYMELEIVDGNVLMVYNLGTEDLDIGELSFKVNDGKYHIVRFTRSGQNSTIQVDNHNVMTRSPAGRQLTIFNSHSKVQIGGKKNSVRDNIEKPFHGIVAGFVFNGHRILDMAVEDDSRITVEGDVQLLMSISNEKQKNREQTLARNGTDVETSDPQMQQPKTSVGYDTDDLIYSGAGSGCFDQDDEDDCSRVEGSADDLITPVYTSTPRAVTAVPPYSLPTDSSQKCDEDDEDCIDGSGSGERTPQVTHSSSNAVDHSGHYTTHTTTRIPFRPVWTPPTSASMTELPISRYYPMETTSNYVPFIPPTHRPATQPPVREKPIYHISVPTHGPTLKKPSDTNEKPVIYDVPLPEIPKTFVKETPKPSQPVPNKSTSDRTVMIIGVIAVGLIVVVIIAPIVLFFKVRYRSDMTYKIDETKNYQFAPVSGSTSLIGTGMPQTHLIGADMSRTSPTDHHKPLLKMPKKKDLKEWYV